MKGTRPSVCTLTPSEVRVTTPLTSRLPIIQITGVNLCFSETLWTHNQTKIIRFWIGSFYVPGHKLRFCWRVHVLLFLHRIVVWCLYFLRLQNDFFFEIFSVTLKLLRFLSLELDVVPSVTWSNLLSFLGRGETKT